MFVILVYIFLIGDLHLKTVIWWICGFLWLLFTILGKTTFLICISTKSLNCDYQSLNILTWLTGCVNTEKKVDCFVFHFRLLKTCLFLCSSRVLCTQVCPLSTPMSIILTLTWRITLVNWPSLPVSYIRFILLTHRRRR